MGQAFLPAQAMAGRQEGLPYQTTLLLSPILAEYQFLLRDAWRLLIQFANHGYCLRSWGGTVPIILSARIATVATIG